MSKEHTKLRLEIGKFWPDPFRTGLLRAEITEVGELAILAHVFAPKERAAEQEGRDNARRLVAAWNACNGIETETLEKFSTEFQEVMGEEMADRARADAAEALLPRARELITELLDTNEYIFPCETPEGLCGDNFCDAYGCMADKNARAKAFLAETAPKPVRLGDEGERMP